jgi:DNA-binding NarL/FixJ family response regulator
MGGADKGGTDPGGAGQRHAPARPLRLVIIDDHQMVLDGLTAMLRPYREQVEIVGESSDAREAAQLIADQKPDAVLLDVRLRGTSGLDLCTEILARVPDCKVVFLTVYDDEQYLYQALRVGAAGFLLKRIRGGELVDHLGRICEGEILIDPALAGRVALSAARLHSGEFWPGAHLGLTQRGDGDDAFPGQLPQARSVRPGRGGGRGAA